LNEAQRKSFQSPENDNGGMTTMDWIEQIFGLSPDGGDGSTEMLYLIAAVAVAAAIFGRVLLVRRARRGQS
jgi:hypothetical protein